MAWLSRAAGSPVFKPRLNAYGLITELREFSDHKVDTNLPLISNPFVARIRCPKTAVSDQRIMKLWPRTQIAFALKTSGTSISAAVAATGEVAPAQDRCRP